MTLKEQKTEGLIICEAGIILHDKKTALEGIDQFIHAAMIEVEMEYLADEAERYDIYDEV